MPAIDSRQTRLIALREAGQHAVSLLLLQQLFAEAEQSLAPGQPSYFMTMLEWRFLAEQYAPARAALRMERDGQICRLLAGEPYCGRQHGDEQQTEQSEPQFGRVSRFSLIVDMNETLGDSHSTYALFARLDASDSDSELARQYAWQALPSIIEAGDFALAQRHQRAPLAHLDIVNALATTHTVFPARGKAPRLAAELMNLVKDVRIAIAVLRGQGHGSEADALRADLLGGLAQEELRTLAQRELDAEGSITRLLVERQMVQERPAAQD